MISGWQFAIGALIFLNVLFIAGCMKVSSECSREEEADEWERKHSKERDGSGV